MDERLLDRAGELQVAPHHDVEDGERHDRRLERSCDPRHVVADVAGEQRVQPGVEFGKEPHDRVLLTVPSTAVAAMSPDWRSLAREAAAFSPTPATARPARAPEASCSRSGASPARR